MLTIERERADPGSERSEVKVRPAAILRVLIVDDHPAVRTGLRQLLEEQPDLVVVDAVDSAEAAMSVAEHEPIDIVVADYQLRNRSGLWLSRRLKRMLPAPRVLVYSAYCDGPLAAACVVAEADGLLSKAGVGAELCHAVREIGNGATRLPIVPSTLAEAMRRRLEPQDQAIYGLLLAGISRTEIAETLRIARADLDARMWTMLRTLEGLEPAAGRG